MKRENMPCCGLLGKNVSNHTVASTNVNGFTFCGAGPCMVKRLGAATRAISVNMRRTYLDIAVNMSLLRAAVFPETIR